jgi:mitogen-activated protein kinase 1/3
MDDIFADSDDCKKMVREIKLLKALNTSNFVTKILDIIDPEDREQFKDLYVVIEYMDADLKKVLKSSITLSELHIQAILYNMICAINWIHAMGVLHRDIKPSNILIDEDCQIKLCDLGLARSFSGLLNTPTKYFDEVK